jgi:thiol-disulfide isomerase/thioredoxin
MTKRKRKPGMHPNLAEGVPAEAAVPKEQWFQPTTSTSLEDARVLLEDVQSYIRHREAGLTPLVDIVKFMADEIEPRLMMAITLEEDHEELREEYDDMEARARNEEKLAEAMRTKFAVWGDPGEKLSEQTLGNLVDAVSCFVLTGELPKGLK